MRIRAHDLAWPPRQVGNRTVDNAVVPKAPYAPSRDLSNLHSDLLRFLYGLPGGEGRDRRRLLDRPRYRFLERDHDSPPHRIAYVHVIALLNKANKAAETRFR